MSRAIELRDAFDRGCALAARPPLPGQRDFLCIRVGGAPSAIALGDVASLHVDLRVVALPTRAPELLGVAAIRAAIVPIYDLAAALGAAGVGELRWTVVVRGGAAGFAFEACDGHARISERAPDAADPRGAAGEQLGIDGRPRPILDLAAALTAIETRWRRPGPVKER